MAKMSYLCNLYIDEVMLGVGLLWLKSRSSLIVKVLSQSQSLEKSQPSQTKSIQKKDGKCESKISLS